jgi:4-amino-4-deoxychorismate lyase
MSLLVESILVKNGWFYNLDLHEERMNNAMAKLYGSTEFVELEDLLYAKLTQWMEAQGEAVVSGKVKCRVLYEREVIDVEFAPYVLRSIKSLKVVYDDAIDYAIKTADRTALNKLYEQRGNCDDILIIKNGFVTDAWAANVLFFDGKEWFTPRKPLLEGTKRRLLLNLEMITEADIRVEDIKNYQKVRLVNAMIDFDEEVDVQCANVLMC